MDLIKPLLTFQYWFGTGVIPFVPAVSRIILILMTALVLAGIAIAVYLKLQKGMDKAIRRVWKRVAALCATMGAIGLLLYGFYYEGIPVLSMRFWWIVWFIIVAWWKYDIWKEYRKTMASRAVDKDRANYEKWLPKPKH
jgi:amino acid transporter